MFNAFGWSYSMLELGQQVIVEIVKGDLGDLAMSTGLPQPAGAAAAVAGGAPALQLQTPPQAGVWVTPTSQDLQAFFDPATYHRPENTVPRGPIGGVMHTTKENIQKIFERYNGAMIPQKRTVSTASLPSSETTSASSGRVKVPRRMDRDELLKNFKLAAQLHGLDWADIVAPLVVTGNCFLLWIRYDDM